MNAWTHFFLGTPRRFLWTAAGLAAIFAAFRPDLAQRALFNILNAFLGAIAPLEGPVLGLAIVAFGLWIVFRPVRKNNKRRDSH
ncbi:MAG TPA: hypothetical protein VF439_02935 [Candidatus Paceibacterota bacterium]